jgi:hypothetical protein
VSVSHNAELVARAADLARIAGRPPMTSQQAHAFLNTRAAGSVAAS